MRSSETHVISCPTSTIVMFDPGKLAHRREEPEWFLDEKELRVEARAGALVALHTPMGGEYFVRVTRDGLRAKERPHVVGEFRASIEVGSGELFLADLGCLPSARVRDYCEKSRARLGLQKGLYEVTVHALSIEPGLSDYPHLVVCVERLASRAKVPPGLSEIPEPWPSPKVPRPSKRRPAAASAFSTSALLSGELAVVGGVALFDPAMLSAMRRRPRGWTADESELADAHAAGELVLIRTHGRGFRFAELQLYVGSVPKGIEAQALKRYTSRLSVPSGVVAFGASDRIPAGNKVRPPLAKWRATVEPGEYAVEILVLPAESRKRRAALALGMTPAAASKRSYDSLPDDVYGRVD